MKQLIQELDSGEVRVVETPAPALRPGFVLVRTAASLVSAGTERMIADFAAKNIMQKARSRPDLVKQVWEKAQRDGMLTTLEAARNRLEQPMALGYSSAGVVLAVGEGVSDLHPGDRVACAGGGFAVHAEIVVVPKNLLVKLPDAVSFEAGAFATLGAIALQGVRLADVKLGETVGVIGLGLLGQLTIQMLRAAGCQVVGMDIQPGRVKLAEKLGLAAGTVEPEEFTALCQRFGGGQGADAVLITADTSSNQPVELAGEATRAKGVVVAVGAVSLSLPRKIYYEKELAFHVSRSYGPGRYDAAYEEQGHDYPYAYVRWTEQRNIAAFVQMAASNLVDVQPLISHRFSIDEAAAAYALVTGKTNEPYLAILLTYPGEPDPGQRVQINPAVAGSNAAAAETITPVQTVRLGVLGAGNYALATLLPALKDLPNMQRVGIASSGGLSARSAADRFGFDFCTTDEAEILQSPQINTVAILTRHDQHARQVISALQAGKHVFVEKPLCLTETELEQIDNARPSEGSGSMLMVGFNRRFAPFIVRLKQELRAISEPLLVQCRVNAGYLPPDHWLHDPAIGGGRLIGEGCHFIDLLIHLVGSDVQRVTTRALPDAGRYRQDNLALTLEFANGSIGILTYLANGDKRFGKERIEAFGGGLAAVMDDYRSLSIQSGSRSLSQKARLRQDKGHRAEWEAIIAHLTANGPAPIPPPTVFHSMRVTLAAQQSLDSGESILLTPQHYHA